MPRRILKGVVKSNKCDKTVIVQVDRTFRHPLYKRTVKKSKRYCAHDPSNFCKEGDIVRIQETKPISKTKSWLVLSENA